MYASARPRYGQSDSSVLRHPLAGLVRLLGDRSLLVAQRAQAERGREIADSILGYAETTSSRAGPAVWLRCS